MAHVLQHPPQPTGYGPAGVVVDYHLGSGGDAKAGENLGQTRRGRQRMAAMVGTGCATQIIVKMGILCAWNVALQVIAESCAGVTQIITTVDDYPVGRTPGGFKFPRINERYEHRQA